MPQNNEFDKKKHAEEYWRSLEWMLTLYSAYEFAYETAQRGIATLDAGIDKNRLIFEAKRIKRILRRLDALTSKNTEKKYRKVLLSCFHENHSFTTSVLEYASSNAPNPKDRRKYSDALNFWGRYERVGFDELVERYHKQLHRFRSNAEHVAILDPKTNAITAIEIRGDIDEVNRLINMHRTITAITKKSEKFIEKTKQLGGVIYPEEIEEIAKEKENTATDEPQQTSNANRDFKKLFNEEFLPKLIEKYPSASSQRNGIKEFCGNLGKPYGFSESAIRKRFDSYLSDNPKAGKTGDKRG